MRFVCGFLIAPAQRACRILHPGRDATVSPDGNVTIRFALPEEHWGVWLLKKVGVL
jgi:hypothetical protein